MSESAIRRIEESAALVVKAWGFAGYSNPAKPHATILSMAGLKAQR